MKKRGVILAAVLLGIVALWKATHDPAGRGRTTAAEREAHPVGILEAGHKEDARLPTKAGIRPDGHRPAATHSPERLREFYLPEVVIDGLTLEAALRKLAAAYEEVCRETGESPLRLTFTVPPGHDRPLTVKLGTKTLDASIRLLAALSGLKVARKGMEYVFEAPEDPGQPVTRTFRVPPDFLNAPVLPGDPFEGSAPPSKISPADYFAGKGITLDPGTRLRFSAAQSAIILETTRAADEVAVSGLIDLASSETPLQHLLETKIIEIPADIAWTTPDLSQLDDAQMQAVMRELTQIKGVDLKSLPQITITPREYSGNTIEIGKELIVPLENGGFESSFVGIQMQLGAEPMGLGQDVSLRYTNTVEEVDADSGVPSITEQASISDRSFANDGASRLHVQTRPDGTRTLVLVKPTLVDATGRPVRGEE